MGWVVSSKNVSGELMRSQPGSRGWRFVFSEMSDDILRRNIGIICLFQGSKSFNYGPYLASNVQVVNLDLGRTREAYCHSVLQQRYLTTNSDNGELHGGPGSHPNTST